MTFRQFIFAPLVWLTYAYMRRNPIALSMLAQKHASQYTGYWTVLPKMRAKNVLRDYEILWMLLELCVARGEGALGVLGAIQGLMDTRQDISYPITAERSLILNNGVLADAGDKESPEAGNNDYWIGKWMFSGKDECLTYLAAARDRKDLRGVTASWAFSSLYDTCKQFTLAADRLGLKPIEQDLSERIIGALSEHLGPITLNTPTSPSGSGLFGNVALGESLKRNPINPSEN
jgi:hypothetical protein